MYAKIAALWFEQIWNERNAAAIDDLVMPGMTGRMEGGEFVEIEKFKMFREAILQSLPDMHVDVVHSISEGDLACVYWEAKATHTGEGMGLKPTFEPVQFTGSSWFQFNEEGKVIKAWDTWNQTALLQKMSQATGPVMD